MGEIGEDEKGTWEARNALVLTPCPSPLSFLGHLLIH
jgi:hypothetical protein